jgi:pSer/pThr/pTyr-binding forkhead associated (FHA) protein
MTDTLEHKTGELVLRIRGTSREGQLLRLRSRKCTIGSGPHCTLRLSAKGVAPLHCLILRGQGGTIVRRWASGTRLNGQPFTDAELTPGDRLKIGPLEFEIVALNEGVEVAGADSPKDRAAAPVPLEEDSQKEERQSLDVFKESLQAEKAAFDLRVFQINQEVVALEKEKESLNQEKTALIKEREAFEESQKKFYAEQSIAIQEQKSMHGTS